MEKKIELYQVNLALLSLSEAIHQLIGINTCGAESIKSDLMLQYDALRDYRTLLVNGL